MLKKCRDPEKWDPCIFLRAGFVQLFFSYQGHRAGLAVQSLRFKVIKKSRELMPQVMG